MRSFRGSPSHAMRAPSSEPGMAAETMVFDLCRGRVSRRRSSSGRLGFFLEIFVETVSGRPKISREIFAGAALVDIQEKIGSIGVRRLLPHLPHRANVDIWSYRARVRLRVRVRSRARVRVRGRVA